MERMSAWVTLTVALMSSTQAAATPAPLPQIWLFMTPYITNQIEGEEGWKALFTGHADWPSWMSAVQVVSIASDWYGTPKMPPDATLRATALKLSRTNIAFATTSLAQSWVNEKVCGQGVEGYTDPPGNARLAQALRADGLSLAYVTMDEPLWFGHFYTGKNACGSSIANVAQRAAAIMQAYIHVFPNVIIGDTEPVSLAAMPGWQAAYQEWQQDFLADVGRPVAFLRADVQWPDPSWRANLAAMVDFAHGAALPVGIIYNAVLPKSVTYTPPALGTQATAADESANKQWLDSAVDNITEIERQDGLAFDHVVFESWTALPIRTVTTTASRAYPLGKLGEDYLVRMYLSSHGM